MASTGGASGGAGSSGGSGGRLGAGGSVPSEPAPPSTWVNATGNLAAMPTDCTGLYRVAAQPESKRVVAGVALHGLFSSDDGGKTWQPLGTAAGSAQIINRVSSITFDPDHPEVFWETGTHTGAGFYKTIDNGMAFKQLGTMTMSQDAAVDFADPARKTLLTGTHGKGVYRSTDGGATFADISAGVPGTTLWPFLIDPQTYLVGSYDGDPNIGLYRTNDGAKTWSRVSSLPPSHDGGFHRASDGALYIALAGNTGIAKSTDQGVNWTKLAGTGASFPPPFFGITPLELPDTTLVTLGADHMLRSTDGGASWKPIGQPLPFKPQGSDFGGFIYAAHTKTFFIWHSNCGSSVLPDAVMSAGFEYASASK
jgi:photosystem II stability/assembly factor-like uncharacterized protein